MKNVFKAVVEKYRSGKEHKRLYQAALTAIAGGDCPSLEKNISSPVFTPEEINTLLSSAIDTDNVKVFNIALKKLAGENPNHVFYSCYNKYSNIDYVRESMLYCALDRQKEKIAMALAKNPKTDINFSGVLAQTIGQGHEGAKSIQQPFTKSPLDLARERGFSEIVSELAARTIELKQKEITALMQDVVTQPSMSKKPALN